jgi:hypothetical protein
MARPDLRWIVFIVVLILMACGEKRPPTIQPASPAPPPAQVSTQPPPALPPAARPPERPPARPTEEELFSRMSLDELNGKQPLGDAFFAYDRADLTEAAPYGAAT